MPILKKIPKIAHFYWDGSRMSYLHYLTIVSFHKFNPEWEINVYSPKIKFNGKYDWLVHEHPIEYYGINYYPLFLKLSYVNFITIDFDSMNIPNNIPEIHKSDILRWQLLADGGGLWSDMDILYFKPLKEAKLPENIDFTISTVYTDNHLRYAHIIGFYLTKKDNPFFQKLYDGVLKKLVLTDYQSVGATFVNNQYPFDKNIREVVSKLKFINIGRDLVYTYPPGYIDEPNYLPNLFLQYDISRIKKNTIGIHWYNGAIMAQKFNNEFNHFTMNEFNNTIMYAIKFLGDDAKIT